MTRTIAAEQYYMATSRNIDNIKTIVGQTITPELVVFKRYMDRDDQERTACVVKTTDGRYFKTESRVFVSDMHDYWDYFGESDERPAIKIVEHLSKRGSTYVAFDVAI